MKLVTDSIQTVSSASSKVSGALETAASTISTEAKALPGKIAAAVVEIGSELQLITDKVASIPSMLDPSSILDSLRENFDPSKIDFSPVLSNVASTTQTFQSQLSSAASLQGEASDIASLVAALPDQLSAGLPDLGAHIRVFQGFATQSQEIAQKVLTGRTVYAGWAAKMVIPGAGLTGLRDEAIAEFQGLKSQLLGEVDSVNAEVDSSKLTVVESITNARAAVDTPVKAAIKPGVRVSPSHKVPNSRAKMGVRNTKTLILVAG